MLLCETLGNVEEQPWHGIAHAAEAAGALEYVTIARADAPRRRMRLRTDKGRDVALSLPREKPLRDGAVVHREDGLMIVVRVLGGPRLRLTPSDAQSGLRLGYFCGNLHWKAEFRGDAVEIHMDGPEDAYRARLADAAKLCTFSVDVVEADE